MTPQFDATKRARAYLFMFAPVIFLLSAFSLTARAGTSPGLFSAVTPITVSVPANSYFGAGQDNGAAFSADGRTALVAALNAPVGATAAAGKAFIYHYSNGQWTQAAEIDDPDAAAGGVNYFGHALALSADGTAALIGSWATVGGQAYAGKAYLYTLSNGTWSLAHEFDDPTPVYFDTFGGSGVSISAHGKTVAMSAAFKTVNSNPAVGEAYVYSETNGTWSQTAVIPDPDGASNDEFGYTLSLAANGTHLLVGSAAAVNGQNAAGKAYLYALSNGTWSLAHEFDDPNATGGDFFGQSGVSLSGDGQAAVIGAYYATSSATNSGAAYVYGDASGSWTQTATIADPDVTTNDYFGTPVAISENGQNVLIGTGAPVSGTYAYAGKAYSFALDSSNGTWTKTHEFDDPVAASGDFFGLSGVALSADGQNALITAWGTAVNGQADAGAAYIYQTPADLSLALSAQQASVEQYHTESLNATVSNTSTTVTANNVVITFPLPAGVSYRGASAGSGQCSASSGHTETCTLTRASLAPGATWQPTLQVMPVAAGAYTVTATVRSDVPDSATSNNAASASFKATAWSGGIITSGSGSGGGGGFGLGALAALGLLLLAGIKRRR